MSLNSLVSITRDSPAYYSWMWVESSRQFETPHIQEARGETVKVSNPRGHSTRTLHQEDSVCHVLWTTELWLLNLERPRQFETPHIQEAQKKTVRVSNLREHSTKTLNQGDSVCHTLWTTDLCLFNLGYPITSNNQLRDSVCHILWTTALCLFN